MRVTNLVHILILPVLLAGLWLWPAPVAHSQGCTDDIEPNNEPAMATPLTAPCVEGTLDDSDQDLFVWTVTDAEAGQQWDLALTGVPGEANKLELYAAAFVDGTLDPSSLKRLWSLDSPDSQESRLSGLLFRPGAYLIGVASSGVGDYRLALEPSGVLPAPAEVEPNDVSDAATPLAGAFAVAGDLQGSDDLYRWTVDEAGAAQRWHLALSAPAGERVSFQINAVGGRPIVSSTVDDLGRFAVLDLAFAAGDYELRFWPAKDMAMPYLLAMTPAGARTPEHEEEPNNDPPSAFPLDPALPTTGRFSAQRDTDFYRITAGADFAASRWRLDVTPDGPVTVEVCLTDDRGYVIQCREGSAPALEDLLLAPGDHYLSVRNRNISETSYTITFERVDAASADWESEPNDTQPFASVIGPKLAARGRSAGRDDDYYRFTVEGEPQLWRIQVTGRGLEQIIYYDAGGNELARRAAEGDRRMRLDGLYLLPGDHFLSVRSADGEYALRVIPLGPPAEPLEITSDDLRDLSVAPAGEGATAAPADTAAAVLGLTEREPNDDDTRAERLSFNRAQIALLAQPDDRDRFRFYLPSPRYVRLTVVPPPDGAVNIDLDLLFSNGNAGPGVPFVYTGLLPPGDHFINADAAQLSESPYLLLLEELNPLETPADLEPVNNYQATAPGLPASGVLTGTVGGNADSEDWYRLPPSLPPGTAVTASVEGDRPQLTFFAGADRLPFDQQEALYTGATGAGDQLLRVRGEGAYTVTFSFGAETAAGVAPLALELALAAANQPVAAFWPEGQRVQATLYMTNTGPFAETVEVEAAAGDVQWTITPALQAVTVPAGDSVTLPLTIRIMDDVPDGPVPVWAAARREDGARVTVGARVDVLCGAAPRNPDLTWTTAGPLFGGVNAAWLGLGATPVGDNADRAASLFDGRTSPNVGTRFDVGATVTVDLAGDDPVNVAGVLLNPQTSMAPQTVLRTFVVETSLDGVAFSPVLSGTLSPLPVEQWFALPAPAPARFARLVMVDTQQPGYTGGASLGEFKVIVAPGGPLSGTPYNLADPARGGHVVLTEPLLGEPNRLVTEATETPLGFIRDESQGLSWVLGFHHNRAAQIERIEWVNSPQGDPARRLTNVEIFVSLESPAGPWTPLTTWTLDPARVDAQMLELPAPLWARYLRFVTPPAGAWGSYEFPDTVRVFEREPGDAYTSILAEYGDSRRQAIYEAQQTITSLGNQLGEAAANDSRDQAQSLGDGQTVRGAVQINVDEDWYRVDVAEPANVLSVDLAGDPVLNAELEILDAAGAPVPASPVAKDGALQWTVAVTPGTYYLRVREPRRSVIFAWDTSGSVGPFVTAIYQSLARFSDAIDPEVEVINLLPFGDPRGRLLLDEWSGDPLAVLTALARYDRSDGSSNAESNLLLAAETLGQRPGQRAVVFITDAESSGHDLTPELWQALAAVRPRIFAMEVSSAGSDVAQDLMQTWADVHYGDYMALATIGQMETGFARAACTLRRPSGYQLSVALRYEAPPTPVPTATPEPTATFTPTPTPTCPAR
ncbi:MAG: hypothetical protein H3C34_03730 [Caldilineaceae bacterium]|nr:hypothetical protein [Caldilineaceae bacterium]